MRKLNQYWVEFGLNSRAEFGDVLLRGVDKKCNDLLWCGKDSDALEWCFSVGFLNNVII